MPLASKVPLPVPWHSDQLLLRLKIAVSPLLSLTFLRKFWQHIKIKIIHKRSMAGLMLLPAQHQQQTLFWELIEQMFWVGERREMVWSGLGAPHGAGIRLDFSGTQRPIFAPLATYIGLERPQLLRRMEEREEESEAGFPQPGPEPSTWAQWPISPLEHHVGWNSPNSQGYVCVCVYKENWPKFLPSPLTNHITQQSVPSSGITAFFCSQSLQLVL